MFAYCLNAPVNCKDPSGLTGTAALGNTRDGFVRESGSAGASGDSGLLVVVWCFLRILQPQSQSLQTQIDNFEKEPIDYEGSFSKERSTHPIGRRKNYNTKKKAKEAAKKAGGGKDPIHHPKDYHGNKRPHYHPNVRREYQDTPHRATYHDHYFY